MLLTLLACTDPIPVDTAVPLGPKPVAEAEPAALRRLTSSQYENAVLDLLGADLTLPTSLEPDTAIDGLLSVGASTVSVSALGVERYEDAAYLLAEQAVENPDLYGCTPAGAADSECATSFIEALGRRAWRRPLTSEEVEALVDLHMLVAQDAESFDAGAVYAIAAVLQSPYFLYRVEMGEPDPARPGQRLLTDYEVASRLSFFLWNTLPDDELMDAADAGELSTDDGLRSQATRMLADQRAHDGVRNLFDELYELYLLESVTKDPTIFTMASPELGPAAREETLLTVERLVFVEDGDYRDLFTSRRTFVDRRLAALYGVPAPGEDGFGEVILPADGGRSGLLGQASTLMLHSHSTRSSATLRGIFIRETLLCQEIPAPPSNVDTSIPEADATSPTLRERVASHLEDPTCSGCHQVMDPPGLALENFDGIGRWRTIENGAVIDASGNLDGEEYDDAMGLNRALWNHEGVARCFTTKVMQYAVGHQMGAGEVALRNWLETSFKLEGHSVQNLLLEVVTSDAFRHVGDWE